MCFASVYASVYVSACAEYSTLMVGLSRGNLLYCLIL